MKKYKSLIVGSLMAAVIISFPLAGFAESKDNNNENKASVENKVKGNKQNSNSIWNRFARFMENETNTTPTTNLSPTISGITAPTVLKTGEMGTWVVKASDPSNGTLSYNVNWGDENNIFSRSITMLSQPIFVQDTTFTHTYSKNGKYVIAFTVKNNDGQKTTSKVSVNIIGQTITTAPVISNLNTNSIKTHNATINWMTDVKANSVVYFSKVSPVDTSTNSKPSRKALVLNHKIELKKLEANTKYYVVVKSTNKMGTTTSSETSFTTLPIKNDSSAPVITELKGVNSIKVGETETITVNAYDPKNGSLSYSALWGDENLITKNAISVSEKPIFVQGATFSHIYSSPGTYTATFTVENSDGKKDSDSMKIVVSPLSVDTTNPLVSDVKTLTGSTTSTISWTTNEPSTSEVFYSTNTPVDVNSNLTPSIISKLLVNKHSLNMSGLSPSTIYHFVIKSADVSNNTAIASESAFITNL
jgi:hypothetical protein